MEIRVLEKILSANDSIAQQNRELFSEAHVFVVNLMGSPGCGKTTIIERTVKEVGSQFRIAVIEGDISSSIDAERLSKFQLPIVQINTEKFGGMCHLEATWIKEACTKLDLSQIDIIFVENVGNLVCPAEFDIGAHKNIVVMSLPEGEDKPVKYPLMFRRSHLLIINKIDLTGVLNFNMELFLSHIQKVNPSLPYIPLSTISGENFNRWVDWLKLEVKKMSKTHSFK